MEQLVVVVVYGTPLLLREEDGIQATLPVEVVYGGQALLPLEREEHGTQVRVGVDGETRVQMLEEGRLQPGVVGLVHGVVPLSNKAVGGMSDLHFEVDQGDA
jgi:hypothetical protein